MLNLTTPIENLARVGPRFLSRLKKLGIKTVKNLLWHFPARYEDFSKTLPISDINDKGQTVSILGRVADIEMTRSWQRRMSIVNAVIEDKSGSIRAVWFNQPYIADTLKVGTFVSLSGKTSLDKNGIYLSSPSYEKIGSQTYNLQPTTYNLVHTGRLVPIYPETEGLTSKYLRFLIKPLLAQIKTLPDPLPQTLLEKYNFPKLIPALEAIHFPKNIKQAEQARQRFAFEEILLFQLRALHDHRRLQTLKAPKIDFNKELIASFVKTLPFQLTNDQRIAAYEILQDLARSFPMNRLLNGDVGSGKTVVAFIAAFQTVAAGFQAVFMAPTEILAKQHFDSLSSTMLAASRSLGAGARLKIGLLTGSEAKQFPADKTAVEKVKPGTQTKISDDLRNNNNVCVPGGIPSPEDTSYLPGPMSSGARISKKLMAQKIAKGEINLIIGTHAVIQKDIKFAKLGLVVIDEQHRFGVEQRKKLVKNSELIPHLLSMTATPIPRTLALTIYGDLDVSLIKEKPKGRQLIITKTVSHFKKAETHKFIDEQLRQGRQVFVICPRIEASSLNSNRQPPTANRQPNQPKLVSQAKLVWAEVKTVTEEYEKLSKKIFPHRRVAMLHGKMKPKEKDEIMKKFKDGWCDVLVSTSVVEVGVDVPNATIMMIESAERFGLAQLHQFRGRVGRGQHQSYCFLLTTSDDISASRRLRALEQTDDGFKLAEHDLKIRGPGEFTGVKQSGLPDIAMTSLADLDLIKKARLEAKLLLKEDSALKKYPALLNRLAEVQRLVHFE